MKQIALIINEKQDNEVKGGIIKFLLKQWKNYKIRIDDDIEEQIIDSNISLFIIRMPDYTSFKNLSRRFHITLDYLKQKHVSMLVVDSSIVTKLGLDTEEILKSYNMVLPTGQIITATLVAYILPKMLKAKGNDINKIDASLISSGNFKTDFLFMKKLSTNVKYINYFSNKGANVEKILDDIFNNYGCCIRIQENCTKGLGDSALILNLSNDSSFLSDAKLSSKTILYSPYANVDSCQSDISILKKVKIDIGPLGQLVNKLDATTEILLCEMYILAKLGKLNEDIDYLDESFLDTIYKCFKKSGFKIIGMDGIRL